MPLMTSLGSKLVRALSRNAERVFAMLRKIYFEAKYPGCYLPSTRLDKNVTLVCTLGSKLVLKNCDIGYGTLIAADHGANLEITDAFVGRNCVIVAREKISIGAGTQIAEMVVIRDQNHRFSDATLPISEQDFDVAPISIGENVWIGAKSTILAGAVIGDGAVIGAHSLVLGDIPPRTLAVGTPAKVKRALPV